MVNKTISIEWELNERLKKEDNASGLISELLYKHYRINEKSEEEIIEEVKEKQKQEERKKKIQKLRKECVTEI